MLWESGSEEDGEEEAEEEPKKKSMPWRERASTDVYEEQLERLHEQLITTMIEKQSLEGRLSLALNNRSMPRLRTSCMAHVLADNG